MNMKKRAIAFVLVLFLFVAFAIVYIFSELYSESEAPEIVVTDAMKFKEEYEKVNGEKQGENTVRELSISKENPFIYATDAEIVEKDDGIGWDILIRMEPWLPSGRWQVPRQGRSRSSWQRRIQHHCKGINHQQCYGIGQCDRHQSSHREHHQGGKQFHAHGCFQLRQL